VHERFRTEARDEFEACLMHRRRWTELECRFDPPDAPQRLAAASRKQGLVLLTPHFDSFYLGIALMAQASGCKVNAMASAVPQDPRVEPAVTAHFNAKYRGLEQAMRGGLVVNMEDGLRPFYRMLQRREVLVVLADAPVLEGGASMEVDFLGGPRRMAGGAWRLAQRSGAAMAAFVCVHLGGHRYEWRWCEAGAGDDATTVSRLYDFMGQAIAAQPGRWWAMDMLPNLPLVSANEGTKG
jgi:lauroyl/myristoyl acyltransferase